MLGVFAEFETNLRRERQLVRVLGGNRISIESTYAPDVIARLASFGHESKYPPAEPGALIE
jgi:hypothetical protein